MADELTVTVRDKRGSRNARRMRAAGKMPAVLYGRGKENVSLEVPTDQLSAALRHGAKLVSLRGDLDDNALISEVQWDAFGSHILHVDLTRVDLTGSVETTVSIELRGEAPGTRQGGIVIHTVHEVEIDCPVTAIPDHLTLTINELGVDQSLTAADLELPEGAKLVTDASTTIVSCTVPEEEPEEEEAIAAESVEPEVIGQKGEEEDSE